MEDIYLLISDCICNMSKLFNFDPLLQLSESTKNNSELIYELSIHTQPIYYSSTNQIRLFRNIHSLTIPKYYQYNNLSHLTHIYDIRYYGTTIGDDISKLTHLTSCSLIKKETHRYFHRNLIRLYDFDYNHEWYHLEDIIKFTQLTHLNTWALHGWIHINELLSFVNLRSLKTDVMNDLSNLCMLTSLDTLMIRRGHQLDQDEAVVEHFNLTKIITLEIKHCVLQNCTNLKYLGSSDCKTFTIDSHRSKLQTLILNGHAKHIVMKLDFDLNECINLRYFECNADNLLNRTIYFTSKLSKLNSLFLHNSLDAKDIDNTVANNLTYLQLFDWRFASVHSAETKHKLDSFDFTHCTNLRILIIYKSTSYVNISKLHRLQHLSFRDKYYMHDHHVMDCKNYLNLTHLELKNIQCDNLRLLTGLKTLIYLSMRTAELDQIWNREMIHLSQLNCLHLFLCSNDRKNKKSMQTDKISHLRLKEFRFNFELNNLNHLNELNCLEMKYMPRYDSCFSKLTKLTNMNIHNLKGGHYFDMRDKSRLNYITDEHEEVEYDGEKYDNNMLPQVKIIE